MATKRFWTRGATASGSGYGLYAEEPSSGNGPSVTGWDLGKTSPTLFASMSYGSEIAKAEFQANVQPEADTLSATTWNAYRTAAKNTSGSYSGSFASGNWEFKVTFSTNRSSGADGTFVLRMYRSVNADGSSATEITDSAESGSIITDLTVGTPLPSFLTLNLGAIDLNDEYLFFSYGWKITGAGGNNGCDSQFYYTASLNSWTIETPDWTEAPTPPEPTAAAYKTYLLVVD